eukprot:1398956-Lingulodinium_polyedra.AAC.1
MQTKIDEQLELIERLVMSTGEEEQDGESAEEGASARFSTIGAFTTARQTIQLDRRGVWLPRKPPH